MGRMFGTDGVRGVAGAELTIELEKIIEAQKRVGNYDAGQICAALTR